MSDRWKCPDCGGWVADMIPVHHCSATTTPATMTNEMTRCTLCGGLYFPNTIHSCQATTSTPWRFPSGTISS